ncbi:MAG: hypothetical protein Ta2F_18490 [Termitinemataceae bacterium]|nr:MAG: hypothetical protein Ta2F_18490 [Termitinemataceae bacterium]
MNNNQLTISIPPENNIFSLYADGQFIHKEYEKETQTTYLTYAVDSAIFLYFTFPKHRRVYLIRNIAPVKNSVLTSLNCLSQPVKIIFKQFASRVDKTRRAAAFLNEHYKSAYKYSDIFYYRLDRILLRRGKINYMAIAELVKQDQKYKLFSTFKEKTDYS